MIFFLIFTEKKTFHLILIFSERDCEALFSVKKTNKNKTKKQKTHKKNKTKKNKKSISNPYNQQIKVQAFNFGISLIALVLNKALTEPVCLQT